ncbi:ribonuclease P protein subunit p29-like protein [Leptotrombidium deliense]|uniref:Ribonuclease P protein subunit p29 n=1 Tax=Leptotrombidium deliense TaxID=299467 RepID=A0A443SB34_9ACAR|nr:ribonuclease P protein subunit p29-like protein [Leptotrombidium deliense]
MLRHSGKNSALFCVYSSVMTDEKTAVVGDQSLPLQVLQVADLIDVNFDVNSHGVCESFMQQNVPEKDLSDEFRHITYSLRDTRNVYSQKKATKLKKNAVKHLNSKRRKQLFDIRQCEDLKFTDFVEIHHIWNNYMNSILCDLKTGSSEVKLLKCDYHGAYFIVSVSRNPSLIGVKGIVVQETKHTFRLINQRNKIVVVPKNGTMFAFKLNNHLFKLNGSHFKMSPHFRSKVKLKSKQTFDDFFDYKMLSIYGVCMEIISLNVTKILKIC